MDGANDREGWRRNTKRQVLMKLLRGAWMMLVNVFRAVLGWIELGVERSRCLFVYLPRVPEDKISNTFCAIHR